MKPIAATGLLVTVVAGGLLVVGQVGDSLTTSRATVEESSTGPARADLTVVARKASSDEAAAALRARYVYHTKSGLTVTTGDGEESETIGLPDAQPGFERGLVGASHKVLVFVGSSVLIVDPRQPQADPIAVSGISGHIMASDSGIWIAAPTSEPDRTWRLLDWQGMPVGPTAVLPGAALLFDSTTDGVVALIRETGEIVVTRPGGTTHVGSGVPLAGNASKVVFLQNTSTVVEYDLASARTRELGSLGSTFAAQTIGAAAISPDGTRLAIASKTGPPYELGDVVVVDLSRAEPAPMTALHGVSGTRVQWLSDSDSLVVSGHGHATVTSVTTGASTRINAPLGIEIFPLND